MEIPKINNTVQSTTSQPLLPKDLMQQILQLGSVEARVALVGKGQALLNSPVGQILSSNTLDLKAGDHLILRAGGDQQNPVLRVSKQPTQAQQLNTTNYQMLSRALPIGRAAPALVVEQTPTQTVLQLGDQRILIPAQAGIKAGQLISLLKPANNSAIEFKLIDHTQILTSALKQLLPQQSSPQQPGALTQLAKLVQPFIARPVNGKNKILSGEKIAIEDKQPATMQKVATPSLIQPGTTGKVLQPPGLSTQIQIPAKLAQQFEALLNSILPVEKLDKVSIQQWLGRLISATKSQSDINSSNSYQLLVQMMKPENAVAQQLQQALLTASIKKQVQAIEPELVSKFDEAFQSLGKEVVKLLDQSVAQQLLQQTSLRYQQELQLPMSLSFVLPFIDQDKLRELRLNIQQNKPDNDSEQQSWDVHLDFEFGLLGMISTHLKLEGRRISASFWSRQADTQSKIDDNLPEFKQQLTRAGYEAGAFYSFAGQPPVDSHREATVLPESLLDIRV